MDHHATIIMEADKVSGPYQMVHYLRDWGPGAYFGNIPAKWISSDGQTAWLVIAANCWGYSGNPHQAFYALSAHEFWFDISGKRLPTIPELGNNIASNAAVTASSVDSTSSVYGAIDGIVGGYPIGDIAAEWTSNNEGKGAWIELKWSTNVKITTIRLYDRPNTGNRVTHGILTFSDGTTEYLHGWLSNGALTPGEVSFKEKTVNWVRFTIDECKNDVEYGGIGLSEFEVYGPRIIPAPDTKPPTPDTASFLKKPSTLDSERIKMSAVAGKDKNCVEYYFKEVSGNPGGRDSVWQPSNIYTATKLRPETTYTYNVRMRDIYGNETAVSKSKSATTRAPRPRTSGPFYYDMGTGKSPVAAGFSRVSNKDLHSLSKGYGWKEIVENSADRGKGKRLKRDFVFDSAARSFLVDLLDGIYNVTVHIGDTEKHKHDMITIEAEKEVKIEGITSPAYTVVTSSFQVNVQDCQLELTIRDMGGADPQWVLNGVEIELAQY